MSKKKGLTFLFILLIIVGIFIIIFLNRTSFFLEDLAKGRVLAWHDEFDKLNTQVWDYEIGAVRNKEHQIYTSDNKNVFCENGILHLKAIKDNPKKGYAWSSGSIISRKGFAFGTGLIEAKVKYDSQKGCWPAFWGTGYNYWRDFNLSVNQGINWPECGEIDMVEFTHNRQHQSGTIWVQDDTGKMCFEKTKLSDFEYDDKWHIVGMERTENTIKFYYDRNLIGKLEKKDFQEELYSPFNVIFDLAIGGGSQENPEESLTETEFQVDWIRYYLPESEKKLKKPSKLKLDCGKEFELQAGQRRVLNPQFNIKNVPNYCINWSSSDESVATCKAGTVKAISNGVTTITAITSDGLKASTILKVIQDATNNIKDINLYVDSPFIDYNTTSVIRTVVKPEYNTDPRLVWNSSDENIATVKDGVVSAINPKGGKVIITCSSADGQVSKSVSLNCKPEVDDTINTKGLVAKYTKKGWRKDNWKSDLANGEDFKVTGDSSTGLEFLSGKGFQQKYISDDSAYVENGRHIAGMGLFDINGPFTVAVRYFYPAGVENSGGNAFEIVNSNGTEAGNIQLQSTHIYVKDNNGMNIINKEFEIDSNLSRDRIVNAILVKDTNQIIKLYINGKLILEEQDFKNLEKMNISGMNLMIGNKSISNAVYQAFIAYDRALEKEEVLSLENSLDLMYK
ncbi:family 16 glycosylhydrolase [Anaerostipes faecalis]|uniref:family 16 glycosylhydrolase n=1 Tax=Anaerostipes faecalis TaxID=2738446 RepID=UPI001C1DCF79|nr:family 16 glycosylhydrolase [Anaerostipes faecalis]